MSTQSITNNVFEGMSDEEFDAIGAMDAEELKAYQIRKNANIREQAHIANGGDAMFPCPACKGSGLWHGKFARQPRSCFKCTGTGKVAQRIHAAAIGQATKRANFNEWRNANADLITRLRRHSWNKFVSGMLTQIDDGNALSQKQIDAVTDAVNRFDAQNILRSERANADKAAKSGPIGLDAINALFQVALDSGKKAPMFRAVIDGHRIVISVARKHADRLYVKSGMRSTDLTPLTYLGKIEGGQYIATREAPANTFRLLCEIASDPVKAAKEYGHSTGECCFCGRLLTDDKSGKSVEMGYGPVCADRFGLNWG